MMASLIIFTGPICLLNQPLSVEQVKQAEQARVSEAYGKLPLSLEANLGQTDSRVKFLSRGPGFTLFLTQSEAVFSTQSSTVLRMKLARANGSEAIEGVGQLPGKSNYFIGNDPRKWRANVPSYSKVKYKNVYSGIDLVYYGNQQELEYDFIVSPGARPGAIGMTFEGMRRMQIDSNGDLLLDTAEGQARHHKPKAYQEVRGARKEIPAAYVINDSQEVSFSLGEYDERFDLVIDPVFSYSTFLGGNGSEAAQSVAVDSAGNAYVTGNAYISGRVFSSDFPTTPGALRRTNGGAFRSVNGGFIWDDINTGLISGFGTAVRAIVIDPINPSTIYAALHTFTSTSGVYKSTDSGASWSQTGFDFNVRALAIDPLNPSTLYVAADISGVFKSTDGGNNWSPINNGLLSTSIRRAGSQPGQPRHHLRREH